jgi:hypothetical protein
LAARAIWQSRWSAAGFAQQVIGIVLSDFHTVWEEEGLAAIRRCARNDPSTFVRVAASLLPHDINLNVGLNAETFVASFRQAVALLGNELPPSRRREKVIDADDADHH